MGDIESQPFIEAIRQFASDVGRENCVYVHVTLLPYLAKAQEIKTKPTQHSVRELLGLGIQADIIVCRTEVPISKEAKEKIANMCNVDEKMVIQNVDLDSLYEVPVVLEEEGLCLRVMELLGLREKHPKDLSDWLAMLEKSRHLDHTVTIALAGKYVALHDAYLSVVEALKHGGIANGADEL